MQRLKTQVTRPLGGLRWMVALVVVAGMTPAMTWGQVLPGEGGGACADCVTCFEGSEEGHKDEGSGDYTSPGHSCYGGVSCLGHLECGGGSLDASSRTALYAALDGIASGSMTALGEMVGRFRERVLINWERSAVQVKACRGSGVVAHIPVEARMLAVASGMMLVTSVALK